MLGADTYPYVYQITYFERDGIMKDKNNAPMSTGQGQKIIELITEQNKQFDKVNGRLEGIENRLAHAEGFEGKLNALQKGVSNLQPVKTDMKQVKKDVGEMKKGIEQLQNDVDTVTSDYGYERDENGKLIPDKS